MDRIPEISNRKQEILSVAQKLISQKGYLAASMRDLAEALNIKPASLYSHYRSKDEILWEISIRCVHVFHSQVLPLVEAEMDVVEKLGLMLRKHAEMIIQNMDAAAIFLREWKHLEEPRRGKFAEDTFTYEQAFADVVQQGIDQGVFRAVKPKFITASMLSSINWIHQWYRPEGSMNMEQIGGQLSQFSIQSLLKQPT
ncbi:MAG: TetR/AcrR family transcriptional regulator [Bacteroidota bacterium]